MNSQTNSAYNSVSGQALKENKNRKALDLYKFPFMEKIVFLNLATESNELLMIICNEAVSLNYPIISLKNIINKINIETISELKNSDALRDLLNNGCIELLLPDTLESDNNGNIIHISNLSLDRYFQIFLKDYEVIKKTVIEFILYNASVHDQEMLKSEVISKMLRQQKLVINTILEYLEDRGKITLGRSFGENWIIKKINHEMFRRVIRNL